MFGGFGLFPPIIKILLISNVVVYILQHFILGALKVGSVPLAADFLKYFALWPIDSGYFLPWQIFTYMFMHGDLMHLFFNMFALWMFGMDIENTWGTKRFTFYYFLCGVGAGIANLLIAPMFGPTGPTVGASGAIYGILVAFGFLFPDRPIYLYFFIPIKAKFLVILYMLLELFAVAGTQNSGIAHMAHLGGGVVGFIYLLIVYKGIGNIRFKGRQSSNLYDVNSNSSSHREPPKRTVYSTNTEKVRNAQYQDLPETDYEAEYKNQQKLSQEKVDAILDKLSQGGYQSLTEEEKRILFTESKKLR